MSVLPRSEIFATLYNFINNALLVTINPAIMAWSKVVSIASPNSYFRSVVMFHSHATRNNDAYMTSLATITTDSWLDAC